MHAVLATMGTDGDVHPFVGLGTFHPAIAGGFRWGPGTPQLLLKAYWRLLHVAGDLIVGRRLNRIRSSMALPRIRRVFDWWLSPQLIVGMFPDWYAEPQAAALPQMMSIIGCYGRDRQPLP